MNLFLLRHTRVKIAPGICYGHTDVEPAETFHQEKDVIVKNLEEVQFKIIYSSPLSRCKILAEAIAGKKPVIYDKRLMELNFGYWEGRSWDEISASGEAEDWFCDYFATACPGGESYQQLLNRVRGFLEDIHPVEENINVLIVTHGGPIRAIRPLVEGISHIAALQLKIPFGELTKLSFQ